MGVLVTGGAGFIGCNLVRRLLAMGEEVRVLDNLATGSADNLAEISSDIEFIEGSICDEDTTARAVQGVSAVFHLAALPSVVRSVKDPVASTAVNVGGTLQMLIAARDAGVGRFVFASSSSVYGDTPVLPKKEDMLPRPMSPYAISKITGEYYCRVFHSLYGLETFMTRYFNVYGPRQNPASQYAAAIPLFIAALKSNTPPTVYGDGGQTRDFTFVEDAIAATIQCSKADSAGAGRVYNVAGGRRISINDIIATLAEMLGSTVSPEYVDSRAGDVRDSLADLAAAEEMLGWQPKVSVEEGLKRTVEWFA